MGRNDLNRRFPCRAVCLAGCGTSKAVKVSTAFPGRRRQLGNWRGFLGWRKVFPAPLAGSRDPADDNAAVPCQADSQEGILRNTTAATPTFASYHDHDLPYNSLATVVLVESRFRHVYLLGCRSYLDARMSFTSVLLIASAAATPAYLDTIYYLRINDGKPTQTSETQSQYHLG